MKKSPTFLAYLALFISPAFFSTNVIFGRAAQSIEPFTLATLRWGLSAVVLVIVCRKSWAVMSTTFRSNKLLFALQGFLGMWVCGAMVYLALKETSATNGTLIYTTPPIMIILIEAIFRGRNTSVRELAGVILAFLGVLVILMRGDLTNLVNLQFNWGDMIFVAAALAWSVYSVILKDDAFQSLPTLPLFALIAASGTLILLPFAAGEIVVKQTFPVSSTQWLLIGGIVLLSSLISFSTFQYGVKVLGPSISGIFMYLLPVWGVTMAWGFLGEELAPYHFTGAGLILAGVIFGTFPMRVFTRKQRNTTSI